MGFEGVEGVLEPKSVRQQVPGYEMADLEHPPLRSRYFRDRERTLPRPGPRKGQDRRECMLENALERHARPRVLREDLQKRSQAQCNPF